MKKIYMVIAQKDFRDEELLVPKKNLENNSFEVVVASPNGGECKGMLGAVINSDISIKDISLDSDTMALVIVGGNNSPSLMKFPELGDKLNEAVEKNLIVGAICLAPMVVSFFGIIKGMSATVYPTDESVKMLKDHQVLYIPENVVVDDWLVTANGPSSADAFGEALVEKLSE